MLLSSTSVHDYFRLRNTLLINFWGFFEGLCPYQRGLSLSILGYSFVTSLPFFLNHLLYPAYHHPVLVDHNVDEEIRSSWSCWLLICDSKSLKIEILHSCALRYRFDRSHTQAACKGSPLIWKLTAPLGFEHPMACAHVKLLGLCFKMGRKDRRPTYDKDANRTSKGTLYTLCKSPEI